MLTKKMPARLESLQDLLDFIGRRAGEAEFTRDNLNRIRLVAEEILVNVIRHAYPPNAQGMVEVRLVETAGPTVIIEIRDQGIPFDPLSLKEPDTSAGIGARKIGGLGVFMARRMADIVRYERRGDTNILTLTFVNRPAETP
jgi:anti-sigma regulatory factor (Ser/Thr protein kinase)